MMWTIPRCPMPKSRHWQRAIPTFGDVDSELRGLGIFSYEHESRELAQKIFGIAELPTKANLSEAEQQMLAYYLGASTYGTIENRILNQMQKLQPDDGAFTARTKRKYLLSRIFPGREWCEAYAPIVYKCN